MKSLMLAGWVVSAALSAPDTTVELRRGDRIVVEGLSGQLIVEAWSQSALEVGGEALRQAQALRLEARLRVSNFILQPMTA